MTLAQAAQTKDGNKAIAFLEHQICKAEDWAMETKNPAEGYFKAMNLMRDTFNDLPAPTIYKRVKTVLELILNARVGVLMDELKDKENSDENTVEDPGEDYDPCAELDCEKCDFFYDCYDPEDED